MESEMETPTEVKIFYKDTQNELQGPFTERQVQDWYREMFFDSSMPFYFMEGDEQPTEHNEFLTLDTLRTLNCKACPFAPISQESSNEKNEERFVRMEKDLFDLSKKCDGVKNLEKQLENLEMINEKSKEKLVRQEKEFAVLSKKCEGVNDLKKRLEDVEKSNVKNKEKLSRQEKELSDLSKKCDVVKNLEKRLENLEKTNEKSKEKLVRREKELAVLSKKCDGMKELKKRLEDVEKRLKELSTQPPPASSSSAATAASIAAKAVATANGDQKPEKQSDENREHVRLANAWAAYYLEVLEAYRTNKWDKVDGEKANKNITALLPILKSEPLRQKCREVLLKKLMELDYIYCCECDAIFHNFNQILVHIAEPKHVHGDDELHILQIGVNIIMQEAFSALLASSLEGCQKLVDETHARYGSIDPASPDLRPLLGFVDHIVRAYGAAVVDLTSEPLSCISSNPPQIVAKMMLRFKKNDQLGRKMMSELHEHIGDRQTRCYDCMIATGSREEYYQHLRTNMHLVKASGVDLITLVVNMYKKD